MNNNKQEPVQVVLAYNPNAEKENLRAKIVATSSSTDGKLRKLDDNNKLMRRYSFDDNGGGYRGL
ncbi:MAG TPA: hypothetical protein VL095_12725 [Flavisolibacter sp.]|nr:hypothetical protein [Flavisolibacter sp.]